MVRWCLPFLCAFCHVQGLKKCNKSSANWWEMFRSFCAPANGDNSDSEALCWWRLVVFVASFAKKCSVMTISKNIDLLCKFIPSYSKRNCIKQNKCTYFLGTPKYNDRKHFLLIKVAPPWFHLLGEEEEGEVWVQWRFHKYTIPFPAQQVGRWGRLPWWGGARWGAEVRWGGKINEGKGVLTLMFIIRGASMWLGWGHIETRPLY